MISSNSRISIKQMQALFILDIFGTGVIILPRIVSEIASSDGWILVVGATALALVYVYIINSLAEMFPADSFTDYSAKVMGKPIGLALSFALAGRLIFTAGLELRIFGEIIRQTMLYTTPIEVTCGAMVLLSSYLVLKGYETRARLGEILVYIVFIPLIIAFLFAAMSSDFTNLLPAFKTPPINIAVGSLYTSFAFRGLELGLLVYPFVSNPKEIKRGQAGATVFIGCTMLLATVVTLARVGIEDARVQLWPVIQIMDTINFPGNFFERQSALILSFWIISLFISLSAGVFFSSYIFHGMFHTKTQNIYILPCAALVLAVCLMPKNIIETYNLLNLSDLTIGISFLFIIPLLILVVAKFRKMGGKNNA